MERPNIIVILNDDMGYSDLGCYGGETMTPNLDGLAEGGLKFTQFYNSPRCSPTRASLLTGLHPHQTGIGILTENMTPDGYEGNLNRSCVTIAEALKGSGYSTYMAGKWHVCNDWFEDTSNWPMQRGFDKYYGLVAGASDYYYPITLTRGNENIEHEAEGDSNFYLTDAISQNAASFVRDHPKESDDPFFMYVAYTSPHWPLQAPEETVEKYKGKFDSGWDNIREKRLSRMIDMGIIDPKWKLTDRDETQKPWEEAEHKKWQARRMEVYTAQIDRMDQGIGKILDSLKETGQFDNTLIIFLADNGGCAEELDTFSDVLLTERLARQYSKDGVEVALGNNREIMPGDAHSYQSYGVPWANVSNTPFRLYKHWTHEGGISTPFIMHWPDRIKDINTMRRSPAQLTDIMPTVLEAAGAQYPSEYNGHKILPLEGESLVPLFDGDERSRGMLFWEHEGNEAVRDGKWKLVKKYPGKYELYDMQDDRTELHDLSDTYPEKVEKMKKAYSQWAARCKVILRDKILSIEN